MAGVPHKAGPERHAPWVTGPANCTADVACRPKDEKQPAGGQPGPRQCSRVRHVGLAFNAAARSSAPSQSGEASGWPTP